MNDIHLYDANTIDSLPWPKHEDAEYAKKYLVPLIKEGPKAYIKNADTELYALTIDDLVMPVTVNDNQYENSYVCSPYSHYVSSSLEYLTHVKNRPLQLLIRGLLKLLSGFMTWGKFNKVVFVNNWLLSTNLYPALTEKQVHTITTFLRKRFPDYTIAFRSISTFKGNDLFQILKKQGFNLIASRPIYYMNPEQEHFLQGRTIKKDFKLLKECAYQILDTSDLSQEDSSRIYSLYSALYLEKYSKLNPQLTPRFIELMRRENLFVFKALKKDGRIDGVMAYFCRNGVMTSPLFGYDTQQPQETGLYRLLSTLLMQGSKERGLYLNLSSGAASYKRWRGGKPNIEYMAIYKRHLPLFRRIPWTALHAVINGIGLPIIKRYEL